MIRTKRWRAAAAVCAATLALAACNPTTGSSSRQPAGSPTPGGTARVITVAEPRSLDPAIMANWWSQQGFLGNALYGTLLTDDPVTNAIQSKMAESFTSSDGGSTFQLKLRPGLTFSDGSPLDAAAVKFNWDRIKNPTLGSQTRLDAMLIASTAVADPLTLTVKLVSPMPNFAQVVVSDSLNWIASPTALQGGQAAFDANPIGAGPYTLQQWTRQDKVELAKNPRYWDAPRPYLDHLTVRFSLDSKQRVNTLMSGGADVEVDTSWTTIAKARAAGFPVDVGAFSGGQYMAMNMRRAPFNDIRARQAVAAALDMNAINLAVYEGKAQTVPTLFTESSPFYSPDLKLLQPDKATAQRLFDELAAAGKPVSFVFKYFPSLENKALAESVQAQLSAFRNVTVKLQAVDPSETSAIYSAYDFDMVAYATQFTDPDPELYANFHSGSARNVSAVSDPALDAALNAGRTATSIDQRKAAYRTVQERLIALVPAIFYVRTAPGVVTGKDVYGVTQYGRGSLLPEQLWIKH